MNVMAKKEPKKYDRESYRKPRRMVAIPERIAEQFESLMAQNASNLTDEVRLACIEFLTKRNLWPPAKEEEKEGE